MKTASKFRKNRRSTRTTNKKRGGRGAMMAHRIISDANKKKSSNTGSKVRHSDVGRSAAAEKTRTGVQEAIEDNKAQVRKAKQLRIETCKNQKTLDDWNHHHCGDVYDDDEYNRLDFYEHTKTGQDIAETWPEICPGQQTRTEFYNNGCGSWKKDGQYYTWGDTEAGKKENEEQMNKCMNIATEKDFENERCYHLDKDGNSLKWFDTNEGKKDLTAKQESCKTDENMTRQDFEKYGCNELGHDWKESAGYEKIQRKEHMNDINIIKYNLSGNLNEVLKSIKEYTQVATDPTYVIGKEVYQLIYEQKHPNMAKVMKNWDHFKIRDTVKQQVNDFVNNQEENEQNKIRKYVNVKNKATYLKHNKHIADLINEKIGKLTKEKEGAKGDVVEIKQKRIKELENVLPQDFIITYSEQQYEDNAVTDEEKTEIETELEQKLNEGVEANNFELVEETTGGKRKRNRKTKKSKKSKRRTRRTRRFKF